MTKTEYAGFLIILGITSFLSFEAGEEYTVAKLVKEPVSIKGSITLALHECIGELDTLRVFTTTAEYAGE